MQVFCFPFEDLFFSRLGYFLIAGLVEMQRACDLSSSLGSWNSVILNSYEKGIFPFPSAFSLLLMVPETPESVKG